MRAFAWCCAALIAAQPAPLFAQGEGNGRLSLLDVPFISQSEALCGGAAAAMVLRFWGERGVTAETFAHLVDRSAAGIRTDALVEELRRLGWQAAGIDGDEPAVLAELGRGRPVLTLIEDRPSTFHYVVIIAWHPRGVVLHDPARGPFVVMSRETFDRKWRAAARWMAVVVPGERPDGVPAPLLKSEDPDDVVPAGPVGARPLPATSCEQVTTGAVAFAQQGNLEAAEQILAGAIDCPAAARELAGIRVLQQRWPEAEDLASAAIASGDAGDYTWQLLATSRFVQNDRLGALAAWNGAGQPRLDLVRVDGLMRTRHRVIERALGVEVGSVVTPSVFTRARRRLAELPSVVSSRLDYAPLPAGLTELRAAIVERPVWPFARLSLLATGLRAAATREVRVTTGSMTGGGERLSLGWRFWPDRERVDAALDAPAPWGGVWGVRASAERQPFSLSTLAPAERRTALVDVGRWASGHVRWTATAGLDRWQGEGARGRVGLGATVARVDDLAVLKIGTDIWGGGSGFVVASGDIRVRSTENRRGFVMLGSAGASLASRRTPLDVWPAGDTGHARQTLLRAHPLLDDSRLRVDRLGRHLVHASIEGQYWRPVAGPFAAAGALFADVARTAGRYQGPPLGDVDVGAGLRVAVTGVTGVFRVDVARGLRDGATALSVAYEP